MATKASTTQVDLERELEKNTTLQEALDAARDAAARSSQEATTLRGLLEKKPIEETEHPRVRQFAPQNCWQFQ